MPVDSNSEEDGSGGEAAPDDGARVARLRSVFLQALATDPVARAPLLDRVCTTDPALRQDVELLLAARADADEFLSDLARRARTPFAAAAPEPALEGRRLGAYRLIRELGRGGMGAVYLAERADERYDKQVAIKLLPLGLDGASARERFLGERRLLARLDHAGIARLLDAGVTEDGTPYFIMEYVAGEPITAWCERAACGIDERIDLFLQVCAAVEYAHRNLIVHRDLKPTNILVTSDGQPKLLDFGIAKLVDPLATDAPSLTVGGGLPMTPAYASPEQLRGETITTSSDVYQLGLLLYELLAGRLPPGRRMAGAAYEERADLPPPSSSATDGGGSSRPGATRTLRRRLRGDLDTIVLTALHSDTDRRYQSVAALADDLSRYRSGHTVSARPDRFTYRVGKLVRRRPAFVAAVATAFCALAAAAALLLVHAEQLARARAAAEGERDRARIAAATAEQVRDFLVGTFELADPTRAAGLGTTARDILDAAAGNALAALSAEPAVQADILTSIAEVYIRLGVSSEARPLLAAALDVRERYPELPAAGRLENRWQLARISPTPVQTSEYPALVELGRDVYGPDHPRFAALLRAHALVLPDTAAARAAFDTAIAILRSHARDARDAREELARTLLESAQRWRERDDNPDRVREALAIRRTLYGDEDYRVARAMSDLALSLELRDPVAADTLLRNATAMSLRTAGESHTWTITVMNNWAAVLRDQQRFEEAEPVYREALRLRQTYQPNEPGPIAYSEFGLGVVLLEIGRPAEALPYLLAVDAAFPVSDGRGRTARGMLVRTFLVLRRFDEAEQVLLELLESSRTRQAPRDESATLRQLAELHRARGHGALSSTDQARLAELTADDQT